MLLYLQGVILYMLFAQSSIPKLITLGILLKIPLINKGMEFIDLPSTFRGYSVQSAEPNYFKNCEVPIICYKYNKPIRSAISNFNKVVSDLDIETCTPDS